MNIGSKTAVFSLEELELKRTDLDKKTLRPYLRRIGAAIRKTARKKASARRVSQKGEYPGKQTGATVKAIKVKIFKSGYGLKVIQDVPQNSRIEDARWRFYPAFLRFGVKRRSKGKKQDAWRIEPRRDYIADAAEEHQAKAMDIVMEGIDASLKEIFQK